MNIKELFENKLQFFFTFTYLHVFVCAHVCALSLTCICFCTHATSACWGQRKTESTVFWDSNADMSDIRPSCLSQKVKVFILLVNVWFVYLYFIPIYVRSQDSGADQELGYMYDLCMTLSPTLTTHPLSDAQSYTYSISQVLRLLLICI